MRCARVVVVTSLIVGCGSVVVPEARDGGEADVGVADAGQRDGGVERDAGPERDGGVEYTLTATVVGVGEGSIQFVGSVRACPSDCEVSGPSGLTFDLRADALAPDEFRGWSGACSGLEPTCRVTLTRNATVGAEFSTPGGFRRFRSMTVVPLPEGWSTVEVLDLNDDGVFVGQAELLGFPAEYAAVRGDRRGFETLGTTSSMSGGIARAINAAGWAVGSLINERAEERAVIWSPRPKSFAIELGTLGGSESAAIGIRADNTVVGMAETSSAAMRAFIRSPDGMMHELPTLGGDDGAANSISGGWIAGRSMRSDGSVGGFRSHVEQLELIELGSFGGAWTYAFDVASDGALMGTAATANGLHHAFYVAPPPSVDLIDIGTLGGLNSTAHRIDERHVVVGTAEDGAGNPRAFIWSPEAGRIVDLNDLLPRGKTEWELTTAAGINNRGQVVGVGRRAGVEAIFFLDP